MDLRFHWVRWPRSMADREADRWYHTGIMRWTSLRRGRGKPAEHEVQVTISPKGENVQVHVDGVRWGPIE